MKQTDRNVFFFFFYLFVSFKSLNWNLSISIAKEHYRSNNNDNNSDNDDNNIWAEAQQKLLNCMSNEKLRSVCGSAQSYLSLYCTRLYG